MASSNAKPAACATQGFNSSTSTFLEQHESLLTLSCTRLDAPTVQINDTQTIPIAYRVTAAQILTVTSTVNLGMQCIQYGLHYVFSSMLKSASALFYILTIGLGMAGAPQAQGKDQNPVVKDFDLNRYTGLWYEIARYDNLFQRGMDSVTVEYMVTRSKNIKVVNKGVNKKGTIKTSTAKLRKAGEPEEGLMEVQFFWPVWVDYRVIALCEDYQVAIATSESEKHFWLLSRKPVLNPTELEHWLAQAESLGFDRTKMLFDDQSRHQQPTIANVEQAKR